MRTKEELWDGCAKMLENLRKESNLSKLKMATLVEVDDHTWSRYERGESAPTVPDFVYFFDVLGKSALRPVLEYIYPDIYKPADAGASIEELRRATAHYFAEVVSERTVREMDYLTRGNHGSNFAAQIQMLTMIDHLPMAYRVAIARLIDTFWDLAAAKGEIINPDCVMPDVELFRAATNKGTAAAQTGRSGYTTACR